MATLKRPTRANGHRVPRKAHDPDLTTWEGRCGAIWRGLREKRGWTREEFAQKLTDADWPTARQTVAEWERGYRTPSMKVLPVMAELFGVSMRSLIAPK